MGCSYDFFSAIVPSENTAKKFVEIFMDVLKDELYCSKSPCYISSKGNGNYEIEIDEYPLFKEMCQGSQLNKFVFAYLKAVPNNPFHAKYRGTYDNCGARDTTEYNYYDGKLDIVETHTEGESEGYCVECGFEWDPYEEELNVCPECGAEFETDESVCNYHFQLIDGEFSKIPE